jgi:hypothetical protein
MSNFTSGETGSRGFVRGPQSVVAGIVLVLLALLALYLTSNLPQGTLRAMGPAMLPRWLAIGVGLCGLALLVGGLLRPGSPLESYTLRGPTLVVIAVVIFGATIRGVSFGGIDLPSLGLIVAGPAAIFISGFATPEARPKELVILALALTAFCMLLFGDLLNLPIPLYPQWLSDLFPSGWSNDGRLRATAGIMAALALAVHLLGPKHREREPIDVVADEHAGVV